MKFKRKTNVPIKNSDIRHPPFCIFIRYLNRLSHQEIFEFLNIKVISAFETLEEGFHHRRRFPCIFIAQDDEWLHIIDPVYYLYYVPNIRKQMAKLGREYDIFYYALGDADYAHDFTYYKNGVKARDFVIQDNWGQGKTIITTNQGAPFLTELLYTTNAMRRTSFLARVTRFLKIKVDEFTYVLKIAKEIGIDTHYNNLKMQAYEIEKTRDGHWEIS